MQSSSYRRLPTSPLSDAQGTQDENYLPTQQQQAAPQGQAAPQRSAPSEEQPVEQPPQRRPVTSPKRRPSTMMAPPSADLVRGDDLERQLRPAAPPAFAPLSAKAVRGMQSQASSQSQVFGGMLAGRSRNASALTGSASGLLGAAGRGPKQPNRTTKTTQKLVVFPDAPGGDREARVVDLASDAGEDAVETVDQLVHYPYAVAKEKEAERTSKIDRANLARVTAYSSAKSYDMDGLMSFLMARRETNDTNPKRIDECIYTTYSPPASIFQLPPTRSITPSFLLSNSTNVTPEKKPLRGSSSYVPLTLLTSSPSTPESDTRSRSSSSSRNTAIRAAPSTSTPPSTGAFLSSPLANIIESTSSGIHLLDMDSPVKQNISPPTTATPAGQQDAAKLSAAPSSKITLDPTAKGPLSPQVHGEIFFFDYGVTVFWGLTEPQEIYMLSLLKAYEQDKLDPEEVETEEFRYQYRPLSQPRIFNDIITLRTPPASHQTGDTLSDTEDRSVPAMHPQDYMIKLTISHAVAQSVKLTLFEGRIEDTIDTTKHIPLEMAQTGRIPMSRTAIIKKIGQLFVMRINVNLVSPILDTPEIFWSEPSLEPLYAAVRGYLEISQRVELLNQRCAVISDLLDMLKEHLTSTHGEVLEWIVIILIGIEILIGLVTITFDFFNYRHQQSLSG